MVGTRGTRARPLELDDPLRSAPDLSYIHTGLLAALLLDLRRADLRGRGLRYRPGIQTVGEAVSRLDVRKSAELRMGGLSRPAVVVVVKLQS